MGYSILVGCDLHDKTLVVAIARGRDPAQLATYANSARGRAALLSDLRARARRAGNVAIVLAYEASGLGFGLYDVLTAAGVRCYVLAPTKIARSVQERRRKDDRRDALRLLELLRGHELAGNALPSVWVPDPQTRDDREVVRMRLSVGQQQTKIRTRVKAWCKRLGLPRPPETGAGWTKGYRAWLLRLSQDATLPAGARQALASLRRQLEFVEREGAELDAQLHALAQTPRYRAIVAAQQELWGVGELTALVYTTEMGDLRRFRNRRQVGAYLGLVPTSNESGARDDCKGHISRQGPARVRRVLCQAAWCRVRTHAAEKARYQRLVARNPQHKKVAIVALMRRLGIRLWQVGVEAVERRRGSRPETVRV